MKALLVLSLAATFTLGAMAVASAQPASPVLTLSAAKKHHAARHVHHPRSSRRASGQIACTVFGCHRIPPNCHPVTGYNWWGDPTGFDDIACR